MIKDKTKPLFKFLLTLCFIFSCFCWADEPTPQYDNLSFGVPGKADTIVNRPGYALGYIEYHEQPAWVIYIMAGVITLIRIAAYVLYAGSAMTQGNAWAFLSRML